MSVLRRYVTSRFEPSGNNVTDYDSEELGLLKPGTMVRYRNQHGTLGILIANTLEQFIVIWSTPPRNDWEADLHDSLTKFLLEELEEDQS